MRSILIETKTDRGTASRISTRCDSLELTVYFKGENDEIRNENLVFKLTEAGSLRVENDNGLIWQTEGNPGRET